MMGISEKVVEALRAGILLNERLTTLIDKVNRMDQDIRHMNERLIRLETLVEIAKMQPVQPERPKIES
jgi:hypothetical protein